MTKWIIHIELKNWAIYRVYYANKKQKQNLLSYCNIWQNNNTVLRYKNISWVHECYEFFKHIEEA